MLEGASVLESLVIALTIGGAIFGCYYAAWRLLQGVRWQRPPALSTEPVPEYPELYELLRKFYRQSPAERLSVPPAA